jgi:hypothetical protein
MLTTCHDRSQPQRTWIGRFGVVVADAAPRRVRIPLTGGDDDRVGRRLCGLAVVASALVFAGAGAADNSITAPYENMV